MIFHNIKNIEDDVFNKITSFLKNNDNKNINDIVTLLGSYLIELKNIKEIDKYMTEIDINSSNTIIVYIFKNNEFGKFIIDLDMELRKIKIDKIKSTNPNIRY